MSSQRYDQLIADLRSDYRPQREWGEGKGVLMVAGHFLVGVAGGTWLMSSIYDVTAGLTVAFALGCLGAIAHLLFLGKPMRAFKMVRHLRTSWISRGFVGLSMFLVGSGMWLAIYFLGLGGSWLPLALFGKALAAIGTVIIIGYMGFCYTASKGIPFWQSPLHPALYIAYALRGGIAALLVISAVTGVLPGDRLLQLWIGITTVVCLFFVLELHGAATGGNVAARRSVHDMLAGRLAHLFYGGTLTIGLLVPVLLLTLPSAPSATTMALIGLTSAASDFFMKLSTVRAGVYLPLRRIPQTAA
jgi:formate-dependent nitrite reductase membrane component NrfD